MRSLFYLYASLIGFPLLGYMLRRILPKYSITYAYQFITFVAMPFLIITSVSASHFIDDLWLAPLVSVIAIAIGGIFGLIAIDISKINENIRTLLYSNKLINAPDVNVYNRQNIADESINHFFKNAKKRLLKKNSLKQTSWHPNLQSNFLISAAINDSGYIAFPIVLLFLNNSYSHYFTIAVIYNLCSAFIGIYILLKILEQNLDQLSSNQTSDLLLDSDKIDGYPDRSNLSIRKSLKKINYLDFSEFLNAITKGNFKIILGSLVVGIVISIFIKNDLPNIILQAKPLIIQLYLVAIGMQINLSKYKFYPSQVTSCLIVKMLAVPIVIAAILAFLGLDRWIATTILIMVAMPPLLIDYQICKVHGLAVEFQVGCHSTGLILLGLTVQLWIALFS